MAFSTASLHPASYPATAALATLGAVISDGLCQGLEIRFSKALVDPGRPSDADMGSRKSNAVVWADADEYCPDEIQKTDWRRMLRFGFTYGFLGGSLDYLWFGAAWPAIVGPVVGVPTFAGFCAQTFADILFIPAVVSITMGTVLILERQNVAYISLKFRRDIPWVSLVMLAAHVPVNIISVVFDSHIFWYFINSLINVFSGTILDFAIHRHRAQPIPTLPTLEEFEEEGSTPAGKPSEVKPVGDAEVAEAVDSANAEGSPKAEDKAEDKAEPKAEDEAEPKAEDKAEAKTEEKPEEKAEDQAEPKAEEKVEDKAEAKTEEKSEENAEDQAEPKAEEKVEDKAEAKTEEKPEEKAEDQAEPKAEDKVEEKPEDITEPKADKKAEDKTEEKRKDKPEDMAEPKAEERAEEKPEEKPEDKAEEKPEDKPEEG